MEVKELDASTTITNFGLAEEIRRKFDVFKYPEEFVKFFKLVETEIDGKKQEVFQFYTEEKIYLGSTDVCAELWLYGLMNRLNLQHLELFRPIKPYIIFRERDHDLAMESIHPSLELDDIREDVEFRRNMIPMKINSISYKIMNMLRNLFLDISFSE